MDMLSQEQTWEYLVMPPYGRRLISRTTINLTRVQSKLKHHLCEHADRMRAVLAVLASITAVLIGWHLGVVQHKNSKNSNSYWVSSANQQSPKSQMNSKLAPTHSISAHTSRSSRPNFQVVSEPTVGNQKIEKLTSPIQPSPPVPTATNDDEIVVVVNPNNPLDELSLFDFQKIIVGKVNNWRQVGGYDLPVRIYRHQSQQLGPIVLFDEKKKEWTGRSMTIQQNENIVTVDSSKEVAKYLKICKKGIAMLPRSQTTPELKLLKVVSKPAFMNPSVNQEDQVNTKGSSLSPSTPIYGE